MTSRHSNPRRKQGRQEVHATDACRVDVTADPHQPTACSGARHLQGWQVRRADDFEAIPTYRAPLRAINFAGRDIPLLRQQGIRLRWVPTGLTLTGCLRGGINSHFRKAIAFARGIPQNSKMPAAIEGAKCQG